MSVQDTERVIQKYNDKIIKDGPHIRLVVKMDENGLTQIEDATMTLEYEEASGSLTGIRLDVFKVSD